MSESEVRTRLYNIVNAVTDVGQVYDYRRWAVLYSDLLDLYKARIDNADTLRGWTVSVDGWPETAYLDGSYPDEDSNAKTIVVRRYVFKIRGYFGWDDANESEKTAIGIVEDVLEALDNDSNLHRFNAVAEDYWGQVPTATLDIFEPRLFGGELVHYAEITQEVPEVTAI